MLVVGTTNTTNPVTDKKPNLKTVEGSPIVKYKKMKKKDLFSLYDRVYEKYRSEISNYENSFNLPNKAPDLYLSNNLHNNDHLLAESNPLDFNLNSHNLDNYFAQKFKLNPKLKDSFVDMTKLITESKTQPYEYENFNVKSLEYTGPLNQTYFNQEFLMLNSILSQLFINNSLQKQRKNMSNNNKKKYRLGIVNVNSFDFYDEYKEEFFKAKEELLLKEAANFILTCVCKKAKDPVKAGKFSEIPQNNFFENFLNKIIRKVEVRKDNNELVSVEFIVNMIREEIEADNTNPILINKRKGYEDSASQDDNYLSKSTFLPPIHSKPMSILNEEDKKVPFLDYDNIANVKRLKRKKPRNYSSDGESDDDGHGSPRNKKSHGRYVKDKNGNWVFEEYTGEDQKYKDGNDVNEDDNDDSFIKYNINNINNKNDLYDFDNNGDDYFNSNVGNHNQRNNQKRKTRKNRSSIVSLKDISEEEANKNHSDYDIELQNKRKRRKNKFLEKIKNQQSPKREFEYRQYFTDENNAEMRRSFNLHMRFQKTHFNFLNKIDTFFLTTHSSGLDDLGQTLGPLGYNYKKKLNELLKKTQDNRGGSKIDREKNNQDSNPEADDPTKNLVINGMKDVESEENNNNNNNFKRGLSIDYEAEMKRIEELRRKNEMQRNMIRKNTFENLNSNDSKSNKNTNNSIVNTKNSNKSKKPKKTKTNTASIGENKKKGQKDNVKKTKDKKGKEDKDAGKIAEESNTNLKTISVDNLNEDLKTEMLINKNLNSENKKGKQEDPKSKSKGKANKKSRNKSLVDLNAVNPKESSKKKNNINSSSLLDKSKDDAEKNNSKKKKRSKKKNKNKSQDERSPNTSILNHLNSSRSTNSEDKKRSRNSSREASSSKPSTLKISRMDLLKPINDEIKEESHIYTENNMNTESSKIEKKKIPKKKAQIVLFDEIKTGKTDSEKGDNSNIEENEEENKSEMDEIQDKNLIENPIKKVAKKKTPKEVEPEKPTYVSTRRYNLDPDEEEEDDDQEDAKLEELLKLIMENENNPTLKERKEIRKYIAEAFKPKKKKKVILPQPVEFASTAEEDEYLRNRERLYKEKIQKYLNVDEDKDQMLKNRINKAMLQNLSQTLTYLLSLCKDTESANNYNSLYQELLKNNELEPEVFMEKIQRTMAIFKKEQEELEELRRHEKRINDFRQDMMDEMYRLKLRKDQKMANVRIRSPRARNAFAD